ncbi:MAG: 1-acyl-sn-glycerol-3-phosphate acyltransferase [Prevotella sp.]|nr:1-acyl-sn-glycerol-3-phosphate acyltransferase [Prevotella sp.]
MAPSFDDIRPYNPDELPVAYERLLATPQFRDVLSVVMPGVPFDTICDSFYSCKTNLEFQERLCYPFLKELIKSVTDGCTIDVSAIDKSGRYTFVSNHRDIVIDSAFLSVLLVETGFDTTCEIAIGDNLLTVPWVKDFVRVNKSFIVKRGLSPRETLLASKVLSDYMLYVIGQKHDNIWIAQREGRAKDSDDRTQPAVLKMMAMGGSKESVAEKLKRLHIVPVSISYEYDPCDFLKAREFQQKRDNHSWKKAEMEDVNSMKTGILGYKGRVHFHCAPCIDEWLDTLPPDIPNAEVFDVIAHHIDQEIHANYCLYPGNYVAVDMLHGSDANAGSYTDEERQTFERYLSERLSLIELADKDEAYLRERLLTMYANPAINYMKATAER